MIIERTFDMTAVKRVITNPHVYPLVTDDGSPKAKDFIAPNDKTVYYLLVLDDNRMVHGLYMLHPMNYITYNIHICLLPSCEGALADEAGKKVLKWFFENTVCEKIFNYVSEKNKAAIIGAMKAGFKKEGVLTKSFLKNGKLENQLLLGITREEAWQ